MAGTDQIPTTANRPRYKEMKSDAIADTSPTPASLAHDMKVGAAVGGMAGAFGFAGGPELGIPTTVGGAVIGAAAGAYRHMVNGVADNVSKSVGPAVSGDGDRCAVVETTTPTGAVITGTEAMNPATAQAWANQSNKENLKKGFFSKTKSAPCPKGFAPS